MKKLFLMITMCLVAAFANAEEKCYAYCELLGTGQLFSTKVKVQADFGQATTFFKGIETLKDDSGKPIKFNSMVDAMNFFGKDGWEFVQAYVVTTQNQNVYHWLLKKEVSKEDLNKMTSAVQE